MSTSEWLILIIFMVCSVGSDWIQNDRIEKLEKQTTEKTK